ncbi:hypothetical protein WN944_007144 [Citrus x changshan-huyou]|uniref:Uncharacterized protein n=1 Tax=Citrus x changshan-huyou TaxID=2935761 RepID=A0AAP0MKF9_9ROSI
MGLRTGKICGGPSLQEGFQWLILPERLLQVAAGRIAVQQNLALLGNQVRLFDRTHYPKVFGIGDVWIAVGWSSDVLPAVKRMSNVAVVVPKSGASLWADLWAIPAASRLETKQIGGRVILSASPSALESTRVKLPEELLKGKPSLDTKLIAGVPPAEILARCEFLEPLSEATLSDYEWLVANLQKPAPVLMKRDVLRWLKLLRLYEKRKMSVCLNKVVANLAEFEKKDHEANATDFFIIVASIVEVSSFEANLKSQPTQEITLRVGMEMFTAVILNMSTALWVMVRLAISRIGFSGPFNEFLAPLTPPTKGDSRCNQVDPGKFNKVLVWRSEIGLCNSGVFQVNDDRMPMLLPIVYQFVTLVKLPEELLESKPSLDTNLIAGVLPAEILARCEFLEPLSEATLSDYEWLVVNLQKPAPVLMKRVQHYLAIGSGQLGQSITSLGKEASATLNITGCTEMAEVVEVLRETKDECLFEQSCYCSDFEYVQGVVHCSLGYGVTFDFKVALKQRKRLTYPPMNKNGWTNSNYSGSGGNNNSPFTFPGSMLIIIVY